MNKYKWVDTLLNSNLLGSDEILFAFILCHYTDQNGENCYRNIEFLSKKSKRCENKARKSLNNLVRLGFVKQELASSRYDIPKERGYVWSLIKNPIHNNGATIAPSSGEGSRDESSSCEPSCREGSHELGNADTKQAKENRHLKNNRKLNPHRVQVSTTVHYSDTLQGGDRGTSSPPSRACADAREGRTYSDPTSSSSPTKNSESYQSHEAEAPARKVVERAEVAAIKQALEEALPTVDLSGVRGLYGIAQTILEGRGELEQARRYVEARGLEWTQRLLEGQPYTPHAIARLIARDAATWRPPAAPKSAPVAHAAPPQDAPPVALPPWWDGLLRQLYEALKGHRRNDTASSRTYAKQLSCLLHHLTRPRHVQLDAGLLTITIDDSGPDPDTFAVATSYIPILLKRAHDLTLDDVRFIRANHALSRAG